MKPSEKITLATIVVLLAALVWLLTAPLPYEELPSERTERNPWGQHLPLDTERLCEGTVLQWHTECVRRAEALASEQADETKDVTVDE